MSNIRSHVTFHDKKLAERYAREPIPMATLFEAYFDGAVDLPADFDGFQKFLDDRKDFCSFTLTPEHFKYFFTKFVPELTVHSTKQDERVVRSHYDRGNDFFGFFLGERMVYTSGIFKEGPDHETLEQAQDNKMDIVCNKLMLKPGESLLDIGCGWGTLARHAAKNFGVDATGVTIAEKQTEFANERIRQWGVQDKARVLCLDYRDTPKQKYDKIVSLEMVEHVGIKNLGKYMEVVYDRLADDGLFLLQWTGLRRGGAEGVPPINLRPEDMIWGLFMAKYIFNGADASLPLSDMAKAMEKGGFEIHSVENVSIHYVHTIRMWHKNWLAAKDQVLKTYGERWFRIWHFFLGWAARVGAHGTAACFQIVANKNLDTFDRTTWFNKRPLQAHEPKGRRVETPREEQLS